MTRRTEHDQREELHAALGHKMMGTSSIGRAAGSNPAAAETPGAGSLPASPANHDKYHAAGIAAMDAYGAACMDAGKFPTGQGYLDAAVEGMAAAMTGDMVRKSIGEMLERYVDDATGA